MNIKKLSNTCMFAGAIFIVAGILIAMNHMTLPAYIVVSIGIVLECAAKLISILNSKKSGTPFYPDCVKDIIFIVIYLVLLIVIWVI